MQARLTEYWEARLSSQYSIWWAVRIRPGSLLVHVNLAVGRVAFGKAGRRIEAFVGRLDADLEVVIPHNRQKSW